MKRKLNFILALLFTVTQGAWATTAYVSTYAELSSAIANASVDNIVVTANIDVPCETSVTSTSNPDLTGCSTAQLVINRSLTLQSQAGYQYTIKRIAANGATTDHLKSLISIRGNGNGTSGTANLTENTVEVTFTNIIIDGGANWGNSEVNDRRTAATTAFGNAGRAMIDVFMGGTLNLEDGAVLQNGFTTYSINSVVNNSGSNNYGGAVRVEYHANYGGGTVNLKAGATIHDCSAQGGETAGYGGALGAYNFAHLNVYGGAIYNCSAAKGGAIGCTWRSQSDHATSGTINLFGGTIHHCYANTGGAILTEGTVADYLLGGTISDCTAASEGGAIAIPEAATQVHIVNHSSGWLTISNCSPNVAGSEKTGYYPCVSMHADATISSTPVYQVTFQNNNTEFAVLNVLQGNSLGEAFPAAPVNANFRFVGWYNGNTQVTSSTTINDNIIVTAKWDFLGSGTVENPYLIPSADVWNYLGDQVAAGNTYSGKYFRQTADISVTTMVGTSEFNSFQGTFNGDGHTLTITKGTALEPFAENSCAPFRHVKNATITNLQVAGTIYTNDMRASGLVATSHGALTLAGCRSSVNINSSKSGDGTHGGLVAITTGSGNNVTIVGCVFDGSFATTSSTNSCGGFVGWTGENTPAITNSLMKPGCVAAGILNNTFARWQSGYEPTITNCYYVATDNLPTDQGKLARNISAGDDVTISGLGVASATYDVSDITAYAHGIKFDGTYYAGSGDAVSLTLSHGDKAGYTFNQYAVSGGGSLSDATSNTPTLTMTDANQTINAEWTANTYTVTFDQQGGTGGSDNVTATYNSAMPSATMPTRAHYTFGGYYTSTDGGGTQYYTAEGASARTWDIAYATTLYAKWTAAPTATVSAPTAKSLTYTGSAQALVNAGTSSDGEIQYKLGDGSWETSIPTATNAGTYTVYYKVVADDSHTDNAGSSVSVTINPASVTLTANSDTKAYNGTEQTVTGFTCSVEGLTFEGVSASGGGTTTGNYDVTFTDVTVNETKDATKNYVVTGTTNGTLTIETAVFYYGAATITWDQTGKTVTFDGTSLATISIAPDITVNTIVLSRTFTAGKPATIMLPFTISANKISGATFYTFSGVTKPENKWIATMNEVTETLTANTPYLVVPTGTTLTFTGGATLNTTGGGGQQTADVGSHWTFKGTYAYKEWITDGANSEEIGKVYGFAGVPNTGIEVGDFVKVASGAKIRPMGCYLLWSDTPNASSAPARKRARAANVDELPSRITVLLVSANGETTGIGELNTTTGEILLDSWWTLDGVKLSGKPAKKGLYIHNGNKVIIK